MAKQSILTADDKAKVKKAIPTSSSTNKIITAGVARVYQASADSASYVHCDAVREDVLIKMGCRWNYAGAEGALVFCADKVKGGLWFRVVDLGVSETGIQDSMWVLMLGHSRIEG